MAISEQFSSVDNFSTTDKTASLSSSIKSLARFLVTWVNSCADYYAAAAMYDQLSKLSNAELHKRGLSPDTLARDVCRACDSTAGR